MIIIIMNAERGLTLGLLGSRGVRLHSRESLGNFLEKGLHIVSGLGAGFDEHHVQLLRLLLSFFGGYLSGKRGGGKKMR